MSSKPTKKLDTHPLTTNLLVSHKSPNPQHQTTPQPIGGLNPPTPQPIGGLLTNSPQHILNRKPIKNYRKRVHPPTISLTPPTCYPQALFISPPPQRLIPPSINPPIKQKTPTVETAGEHKKKLN